jgi:hypothetical protein
LEESEQVNINFLRSDEGKYIKWVITSWGEGNIVDRQLFFYRIIILMMVVVVVVVVDWKVIEDKMMFIYLID